MFHLAWLWNTNVQQVLMIGLGGGSTQRSFLHYYPKVHIDSVDLDPVVVNVATNLFFVPVSERHQIHLADGRVYLRRTTRTYDLIVLDAYFSNRYGSHIPPHLITREFVELARDHLGSDGVLAYNVIGTVQGWKSDLVAALIRTLYEVFPVVYYAPATTSQNVVLFACRSPRIMTGPHLRARASALVRQRSVTLPTFLQRMTALRQVPVPPERTQVLTDDHAPVESLAK
jgi:spermidine synthase